MGARREVVSAVTERYRSAKRTEKGRILDALCATTGWHRKHAVRALRQHELVGPNGVEAPRERSRVVRIGGFTDDFQIVLGFQYCAQPVPKNGVIIGENHA